LTFACVEVAGIEMIDRHPVEPRPEIFFHLRHETAGQRLQVGIFGAILGRDDETELVRVALPARGSHVRVGCHER